MTEDLQKICKEDIANIYRVVVNTTVINFFPLVLQIWNIAIIFILFWKINTVYTLKNIFNTNTQIRHCTAKKGCVGDPTSRDELKTFHFKTLAF
jgi:hypothetical protein